MYVKSLLLEKQNISSLPRGPAAVCVYTTEKLLNALISPVQFSNFVSCILFETWVEMGAVIYTQMQELRVVQQYIEKRSGQEMI